MENNEKRVHKRIGSSENPLRVKILKLCNKAVIPEYAHPTDAGMDLYATSRKVDAYGNIVYGTGIALEIPKGYVGLLYPRSSITNTLMSLGNCVGIIDSGYRGEVTFKFHSRNTTTLPDNWWNRLRYLLTGKLKDSEGPVTTHSFFNNTQYEVGERIGQLIIMPYPKVQFVEVDELAPSDRGEGGYGSSGRFKMKKS